MNCWKHRTRLTRWPLTALLAPLMLLTSGHGIKCDRGQVHCSCGAVAGRLITTAPHGMYSMGDGYTALDPSPTRQCLLTWAWRTYWFSRSKPRHVFVVLGDDFVDKSPRQRARQDATKKAAT